jgi:hypothetical protein
LPRCFLGVMKGKMGKQVGIREMPETGAVIGHGVSWSRDVRDSDRVAVLALVQGLEAEEVRGRARGGGAAFRLPGGCRGVVREGVYSFLTDIQGVDKNIVMGDGAGELEVRIADRARGIVERDQGLLNVGRKRGAPEDWLRWAVETREECDAAHAHTCGIASPHQKRVGGDNLAKAGRALFQGRDQGAEVIQEVMEFGGERDACPSVVTERFLHEAEKATKPGNGAGHAAQFAENFLPFVGGDATLGTRE